MSGGKKSPRVVCAAIRHKITGAIICGARHFDKIMCKQIEGPKIGVWADADQGFIDQFGNFMTRQEAYVIAEKNGQFFGKDAPHEKGCLYSEDLY